MAAIATSTASRIVTNRNPRGFLASLLGAPDPALALALAAVALSRRLGLRGSCSRRSSGKLQERRNVDSRFTDHRGWEKPTPFQGFGKITPIAASEGCYGNATRGLALGTGISDRDRHRRIRRSRNVIVTAYQATRRKIMLRRPKRGAGRALTGELPTARNREC